MTVAVSDARLPVLREASEDDLDAIWGLETTVFGAEAWTLGMMREELTADHRHYLVLTNEEDQLIGYGGLLAIGPDGDIQTIAIAPQERGAGYGRRILNALIDEAEQRTVRNVFLEVRADNPRALSLYASIGFAEIGVRPRYYQPGDVDAVVMKLEMRNRR